VQGFTVVAELRDDYTGYEFERPAFDKVGEMIAKDQADTLICPSGDHLARSVLVIGWMASEFLRRYHVNLHIDRSLFCGQKSISDLLWIGMNLIVIR
jgi:Resolvase, N terminal domain